MPLVWINIKTDLNKTILHEEDVEELKVRYLFSCSPHRKKKSYFEMKTLSHWLVEQTDLLITAENVSTVITE